jgi:hypothetical protein
MVRHYIHIQLSVFDHDIAATLTAEAYHLLTWSCEIYCTIASLRVVRLCASCACLSFGITAILQLKIGLSHLS